MEENHEKSLNCALYCTINCSHSKWLAELTYSLGNVPSLSPLIVPNTKIYYVLSTVLYTVLYTTSHTALYIPCNITLTKINVAG